MSETAIEIAPDVNKRSYATDHSHVAVTYSPGVLKKIICITNGPF
jgi:hypothetical protein